MARSEKEIQEISARVKEVGPWFSAYNFGDGITAYRYPKDDASVEEKKIFERLRQDSTEAYFQARTDRVFSALAEVVKPEECTLLDIGCADGYFSVEARKRGFKEVVGVDFRPESVACARCAADIYGLDNISFETGNLYELHKLGRKFDVVLCLGLFYHLKNPILGLEKVREVATKASFFAGWVARGSELFFEMQIENPSLITSGDGDIVLIPTLPALRRTLEILGYKNIRELLRGELPADPHGGGWRELVASL